MDEYIITEVEFIKQAQKLLNLIIPELSQSVIIDLLSIKNVGSFTNYESIQISYHCDFLKKYMSEDTIINLMKKFFDESFPQRFCDCIADYFDEKDGIACRICSLIVKRDTILEYVIVLFRLEEFNKIVEDVYCDVVNGKKIYIFIETLIWNILHYSLKHISSIEYPQIARDIATHSIDYILCKNLMLPHQDIFILLSSLYYEGSSTKAKMVQVNPLLQNKYERIVKLENPLCLLHENVYTIRKLLELSRQGYALVLSGWDIVAITKHEYLKDIPHLSIDFLGHMHWQLCMSEKTIFRYQDGKYYISNGCKSINYYKNSLMRYFENVDYNNIEALSKVIELAALQKHGTSIIVTDEAKDETERLCLLNRGIRIEELELKENAEIILALTSIDGAVLLNLECKCYGIGLILDGEAICVGDPSRGARYNSIVNYIKIKKKKGKKYMAFIISEDGMINIIS